MSVIRAFIAIGLSEEVLNGLDRTLVELKKRLPKAPVRWIPSENIHLTIKFLGDVSAAGIDLLTQMLQTEAARHAPFEFTVGGLGAFPSVRRARVIWIGVEAPPALAALQRGVDAEMARLGYASEGRDFSPHLTLGRVNRAAGPADLHDLAELLDRYPVDALGKVEVQAVHLYRSDLHSTGSVYTRLFTANLGGNAP